MLFTTIKRKGEWGIRDCSLNRRVKEASAVRWDLDRDLKQEGLNLAVTQAESFSGRETKLTAESEQQWSCSDSTFLISPLSPGAEMAPQCPTHLPLSTQSFPSCFLSRYALLYCPPVTPAPSTCPSPTWLILPAIWMSTTLQVPDQRPLHLGHFSDTCQSMSTRPDWGVECWVYQSPAVWHWALSLSLSFYSLICKVNAVERTKWDDCKVISLVPDAQWALKNDSCIFISTWPINGSSKFSTHSVLCDNIW